MKKFIFSLLFVGFVFAASAQDEKNKNTTTVTTTRINDNITIISSTADNPAYIDVVTVPYSVQYTFQREYPAIIDVEWIEAGDWYRANYDNNGRSMHVFYHTDGTSYTLALPVMLSNVPDEVIDRAVSEYGGNIYGITTGKDMNGKDRYQVTLIENGSSRTVWLDEEPLDDDMDDADDVNGVDDKQEESLEPVAPVH